MCQVGNRGEEGIIWSTMNRLLQAETGPLSMIHAQVPRGQRLVHLSSVTLPAPGAPSACPPPRAAVLWCPVPLPPAAPPSHTVGQVRNTPSAACREMEHDFPPRPFYLSKFLWRSWLPPTGLICLQKTERAASSFILIAASRLYSELPQPLPFRNTGCFLPQPSMGPLSLLTLEAPLPTSRPPSSSTEPRPFTQLLPTALLATILGRQTCPS